MYSKIYTTGILPDGREVDTIYSKPSGYSFGELVKICLRLAKCYGNKNSFMHWELKRLT